MNDILANQWQLVFFGVLGFIVLLGAVAYLAVRGDPLGERLVRRTMFIAMGTVLVITGGIFLFFCWVASQIPS